MGRPALGVQGEDEVLGVADAGRQLKLGVVGGRGLAVDRDGHRGWLGFVDGDTDTVDGDEANQRRIGGQLGLPGPGLRISGTQRRACGQDRHDGQSAEEDATIHSNSPYFGVLSGDVIRNLFYHAGLPARVIFSVRGWFVAT